MHSLYCFRLDVSDEYFMDGTDDDLLAEELFEEVNNWINRQENHDNSYRHALLVVPPSSGRPSGAFFYPSENPDGDGESGNKKFAEDWGLSPGVLVKSEEAVMQIAHLLRAKSIESPLGLSADEIAAHVVASSERTLAELRLLSDKLIEFIETPDPEIRRGFKMNYLSKALHYVGETGEENWPFGRYRRSPYDGYCFDLSGTGEKTFAYVFTVIHT